LPDNSLDEGTNILKIPKEWLSPVIWGIPLAVLLIDAAVRGKVLLLWSFPEWAVYLFSAAVGLLFWFLFFHLGVLLFKSGRAIPALAALLVFLAEICALIISYGFYHYFRGIPNYFVGEFILQEPKDFYSGVAGTVTAWHFSALALLTVGLSGLWIWQVKKFSGCALSLRQFGAGLLLFAISAAGMLEAVQVYDQAAMPDLNTIFLSSHLVVNNLILKRQVEGSGLQESRRISLPRYLADFEREPSPGQHAPIRLPGGYHPVYEPLHPRTSGRSVRFQKSIFQFHLHHAFGSFAGDRGVALAIRGDAPPDAAPVRLRKVPGLSHLFYFLADLRMAEYRAVFQYPQHRFFVE